MTEYIPVLVIFGVASAMAGVIPVLSWFLGPKNPTPSKLGVYECGLNPIGTARERFSVKFYLVAILFIIFDIEIVFMYPWAIYFHKLVAVAKQVPGAGFATVVYLLSVMGVFFIVLTLGLAFVWRKGVLDWSRSGVKPAQQA